MATLCLEDIDQDYVLDDRKVVIEKKVLTGDRNDWSNGSSSSIGSHSGIRLQRLFREEGSGRA